MDGFIPNILKYLILFANLIFFVSIIITTNDFESTLKMIELSQPINNQMHLLAISEKERKV